MVLTNIAVGLAGGAVATVVMTAVMMVVGDGGPPPTAAFVAKFAGGEPDDYKMPGMLLHIAYGVGAGAFFAVAVAFVVLGSPAAPIASVGVALSVGLGLAYGIVLMVVGMVFWMRTVIGIEPDKKMMMVFGVAHLVYGVVLGGFVAWGVV